MSRELTQEMITEQEIENLRQALAAFLKVMIFTHPVSYQTIESFEEEKYVRHLIEYEGSELDPIRAYFFIPKGTTIRGAVLVHHQHNGERHLGKSEVSGLVGDPYQAFCPALAEQGIITLAPDSICFEDRRKNKQGIEEDDDPDNDSLQHYNEMCYRLLYGDLLMRKVIADSFLAINLLYYHPLVNEKEIGILGHSYGGNTALFQTPFDERIKYTCSSGAVCSYRNKVKNGTGIELAEVIPGFASHYDIDDLVKCMAPRDLLILSATEDKYAKDADDIFSSALPVYQALGAEKNITHYKFDGGHALNEERFNLIIDWFSNKFSNKTQK
jgi:dienelactone hydrolase